MTTPHSSDQIPRPRIPSYPGPPLSPQYNRSHPSSPSAARLPPPSSPSQAARERASAGYYDPTQDSRDRPSEYARPVYQVCTHLVLRRTIASTLLFTLLTTLQSRSHPEPHRESNGYHYDPTPSRSRAVSQSSHTDPSNYPRPVSFTPTNGQRPPSPPPYQSSRGASSDDHRSINVRRQTMTAICFAF